MQQLIEDEGAKFLLAVPSLTKGRYVDDVFGGADSIEEAQSTVKQVNNLCLSGCLPLQKWTSNNEVIIQHLPIERRLFPPSVPIDQQATVHTLGMSWNPVSDTFHFTWTTPGQTKITKKDNTLHHRSTL